MLERVFPGDVVTVVADEDAWQGALLPEEELDLGAVGDGRRRDFRAGRACARQALTRLGLAPGPLRRRPDRSPEWPAEAVGSISHCPGLCAAAVARAERYVGLGLDVEATDRASPRIARRICREEERARLPALGPQGLGIVFSIKEAFYKAWNPLTGAELGFQDVTVELDPEAGRFLARLVRHDAPSALGRREAEGGFVVMDRHVGAGLVLPRG